MLKVLFIGSQDKYRSKFASLYFNSICKSNNLSTRALSAGFNVKPQLRKQRITAEALDYLGNLGILVDEDDLRPTALTEALLDSCDKLICMDMDEHMDMMRKKYPVYVRQCSYWHYPVAATPGFTLPRLVKDIDLLFQEISLSKSSV